MRCRPILFSAPMVRALLAGTKTQTRRAVKAKRQPARLLPGERWKWMPPPCPYGVIGDRLWVKETFLQMRIEHDSKIVYLASTDDTGDGRDARIGMLYKWKPSIFMPRWASRITLEITDVRVQRLNDITTEDALAEGVSPQDEFAKLSYARLWRHINGDGSWDANPAVWAISFARVDD